MVGIVALAAACRVRACCTTLSEWDRNQAELKEASDLHLPLAALAKDRFAPGRWDAPAFCAQMGAAWFGFRGEQGLRGLGASGLKGFGAQGLWG